MAMLLVENGMGRLLTKQKIREIAGRLGPDPDVRQMADLADQRRRQIRTEQAAKSKSDKVRRQRRRNKREAKPQLHATDYISAADYCKLVNLTVERRRKKAVTRKAINQALIVVMTYSGLRIGEVCNLKLGDLPSFHKKGLLQIKNAKGKTSRTVEIDDDLVAFLEFYVNRYKKNCGPDNYLFLSERGDKLSTACARAKIKALAIKAGIWTFQGKDGNLKTKLKPHGLRHTCGMYLLDSSGEITIVQSIMGHRSLDTTRIYAHSLPEKRMVEMNKFAKNFQLKSGVQLQKLIAPTDN